MRYNTLFVTMAALALLSACGDSKSGDSALSSDSALGRDLAMAAADSMAQPKLQDVPEAPTANTAPATKAPAPKPAPKPKAPQVTVQTPVSSAPAAPAAPATGTIAAGTTLSFAAGAKVCSNTTNVGDTFTAPLSNSVSGSNNAEIPAGAVGTFEVVEARTAKNSGDTTVLRVRLLSITVEGRNYPVEATVQTASTERVRSATKGTDAKKVAGGAVIGAIAGRVIGGGAKGTVIGAAAGAAAGTAAASATADYDTCLNSGAPIVVRLSAPATVRVGS